MANASKRRCKAKNRRGERCGVTVINAAGYCVAHDPKRPADMRELGKRSAKARRGLNLDRVHPSLREYLRAEVPPAEVWQALKRVLEGENESARVAASRVLMDALSEPAGKVSVGVAVAEMRAELARAGPGDRRTGDAREAAREAAGGVEGIPGARGPHFRLARLDLPDRRERRRARRATRRGRAARAAARRDPAGGARGIRRRVSRGFPASTTRCSRGRT